MEILILTGISGAGKTFANKCVEDLGYYCVDNLPPALILNFVELCAASKRKIDKISIVIDIRSSDNFDDLFKSLDPLDQHKHHYRILYLDSTDESLVRRYKETRRSHPLATDSKGTLEAIREERSLLRRLKERADLYLDTTNLNMWDLKKRITELTLGTNPSSNLKVSLMSFGYKHGVPLDADFVLDVRFLPNPYYHDDLKQLSGENLEVYQYVMQCPQTQTFLSKLTDLLLFVLPEMITEGKSNFTIAIGCTGGHHRSVVLAIELSRTLTQHGYHASVRHRDIQL